MRTFWYFQLAFTLSAVDVYLDDDNNATKEVNALRSFLSRPRGSELSKRSIENGFIIHSFMPDTWLLNYGSPLLPDTY